MNCLSPETQHLILIGDHLQLRPKVEDYTLSKESGQGFNLDLSLFERLVLDQQFPIVTLSTQRRMRPQIADLLRLTLYPELKDAGVVQEYPQVRGVSHPLWWFDHKHEEDKAEDEMADAKSKSNVHTITLFMVNLIQAFEVEMTVKLARYLLQQGYTGGDITILTPYLGQLIKIRDALSKVTMVFVNERDEEGIQKLTDSLTEVMPE